MLTLTCISTTTDCFVKYTVVGKCVPNSTKCLRFAVTPVAVTASAPLNAMIKASGTATTALTCNADQRMGITSVRIMEVNGSNLNANVVYKQDDARKVSVMGVS